MPRLRLLSVIHPRQLLCLAVVGLLAFNLHAAGKRPVLVGLDAAFGVEYSQSAQAIELGLRAAIREINAGGGVLGGRPLELVVKDNRAIPARGVRNLRELASLPDLVAVFGGRFSPVVIEQLPLIHDKQIVFIAPWSAADSIVDNGMNPNYVFRVSLRDSLAMPKLLDHATERGFKQVGLLLVNTSWGRSNYAAAQAYAGKLRELSIAHAAWYHWRDKSLSEEYRKLLEAGAQAVVFVGTDDAAAVLIREIAAMQPIYRLPIIAHWGITGGDLAGQVGSALQVVDLSVVQSFSFFQADKKLVENFMQTISAISPIRKIEQMQAPVGTAHAYDAMHILAKAINLAGTTSRPAVRDALENVREHRGLIKHYRPPFTPTRHEALGPAELLIARYRADGVLIPVER